ncbi:ATP-binding cassette domain-containing protein [Streptococcus suis]|uniref:ATP-binding cassette domain-containing protein n=1 Tax=Streptococcus suis TaxID=1307 RepID=UPI0019505397|nr:ABC transporter ATP-binding protein [Streptococcus suis]UAJ07005.1 ABC transporter ATP-binding protein/permease [Streptococcus suis]HEM4067770.1 ABC transporter ATP-binding protein [Streptococcus suis]
MFYYLRKCKLAVVAYIAVSVVYALILAATGFVYARVSESALSGNQQVFLISSLIAVGFFICDIYFDYLPRYLKFKLVNRIMELTRNELVATYAVSYGLSSIVYSGSWIIGGIFVFQGMLKISDLIAMTTLMGTVAGPIQTMSGLITEYLASRTVVEELTTILKGQSHEDKVQQELTEPIRTLTLDGVSSHNQQHPIFDNFSYQFLADKKYAIVGKSGSGKTTLLRLLLGVQSPDEGAIFINQINISEVAQASYFDKMYYLPQKTAIFATTIGDNLTLFETLDEAKALKCLEQVGLLDWFERQEAGFDTPLSSSKQLSGGEERRFDLARALYRDAEVLLFDEPTTGLDSENEAFIAETLANIKEKLLIVVTHSQSESFLSVFDEKVEL